MGRKRQPFNRAQCNYLSKDSISRNLEKFRQIQPEQKISLHILEITIVIKGNKIEVRLLLKKENTILLQNRELPEKRLYSLEKKLTKNSHFEQLYEQQINGYFEKRYAKKLSENKLPKISTVTNYVSHHGVLNVNKPNNVRIIFDAAAIYQKTSLNNNILPQIDILNNFVSV